MPGAPQEQGWAPPPADLLAVRLNMQLHGAVDQDGQVVVHVIKHEELALTAVAGAWCQPRTPRCEIWPASVRAH